MLKAAMVALPVVVTMSSTPVEAANNAVYLIAQVEITDQTEFFQAYGVKLAPLLQKAGAQVLVATPDRQKLEGDWPGNWTVVIKFASEADASNWYNSDAYQAIRPTRLRATSLDNLALVPAFTPPSE